MKIKRALISVSDKTGIASFARGLSEMGVMIVSTGGTAALLKTESIPVQEIEEFTGFPEILGGRVKTLHPRVHGGLLYVRTDPSHQQQMEKNAIEPIDMVVVNLYPFEQTIRKPDVKLEEAIEQIDIGGPSMLRSAAKNYRFVTTVSDPQDYETVLEELREHDRETTLSLREQLAIKVFLLTSRYDGAIASYLNREPAASGSYAVSIPLETRLRYGENPHQNASLYGRFGDFFQ
jgi:phosphoribosylaminoimidazolecarboxamide formyltransferase / IMP cyclohydrolase